MKQNIKELISSIVLILLLVLVVNPFHVMASGLFFVSLAALIVAFGVFAAFIMKEKATDERERAHRMGAGRAAFFTGSFIILLGIIAQVFSTGRIDPWLVATLVGMIIAKIFVRVYSDRND